MVRNVLSNFFYYMCIKCIFLYSFSMTLNRVSCKKYGIAAGLQVGFLSLIVGHEYQPAEPSFRCTQRYMEGKGVKGKLVLLTVKYM